MFFRTKFNENGGKSTILAYILALLVVQIALNSTNLPILKGIKVLIPGTKIKIIKKGTPGDQKKVCANINRLIKTFGPHKFLKLSKGLKIFSEDLF